MNGMPAIRAITLDLDDTLWENTSVIERAEEAVQDTLRRKHPAVARRYSIDDIREWRERVARERTDIGHDYGDVRSHTYRSMLASCGLPPEDADHLIEVFMEARNEVTLFEDTIPALQRLSAALPVVSLSNGNADIDRIGIHRFFHDRVNPGDVGAAKPDVRIFHCAQRRLGLEPREILHIGNHPVEDVGGARNAGFQTAWVNREQADWTHPFQPDYVLHSMHELDPILGAAARPGTPSQER